VPVATGRHARATLLAQNDLVGASASRTTLAGLECRRWGGGTATPVLWCRHDDVYTRDGRYYPHNWPATAGEAFMRFFATLE
jgi:polyhydroxybutyrate depolymerase